MLKYKKLKKVCEKGCTTLRVVADELIDISSLQKYSELGIDVPIHGMMGTSVRIEDILNIPIVVLQYKTGLLSKFPNDEGEPMTYTAIQFFYLDDPEQTPHVVSTASKVLKDKLLAADGKFPFISKIVKVSRHYEFI